MSKNVLTNLDSFPEKNAKSCDKWSVCHSNEI